MGQWLVFEWFWVWGTLDTQLARQKLSKKTHPNHGDHHGPTAAMVPSSGHRYIHQIANMLHSNSISLTLENIVVFTIVFISYFKARPIVDAPCLCVCGSHQQAVLRVSHSQRAVLRV